VFKQNFRMEEGHLGPGLAAHKYGLLIAYWLAGFHSIGIY